MLKCNNTRPVRGMPRDPNVGLCAADDPSIYHACVRGSLVHVRKMLVSLTQYCFGPVRLPSADVLGGLRRGCCSNIFLLYSPLHPV